MEREGRAHEDDVADDEAQALSRATGGDEDPSQPDQHSSTGTTDNEVFVGRVSGQDTGYAGETGAGARSKNAAADEDG